MRGNRHTYCLRLTDRASFAMDELRKRGFFVCHAEAGKRHLSLYSQCDTHATLPPNCRDSVAWVSSDVVSLLSPCHRIKPRHFANSSGRPSRPVTVRQSLSKGCHTTLLPSLREVAKPASPSSLNARWDLRSFAPNKTSLAWL